MATMEPARGVNPKAGPERGVAPTVNPEGGTIPSMEPGGSNNFSEAMGNDVLCKVRGEQHTPQSRGKE